MIFVSQEAKVSHYASNFDFSLFRHIYEIDEIIWGLIYMGQIVKARVGKAHQSKFIQAGDWKMSAIHLEFGNTQMVVQSV